MLQLLLFGLCRAGWRPSSYFTAQWRAWEHKPSCTEQEIVLCKKLRNPAKHVALLFAQNSAPGSAEHIAGHSDLPRNLGEDSSASKAELCLRLSLLSSGVPGLGGNRFSLAANLSTHFCSSEEQGLQQQVLNLHQLLMPTNHREVPGKICCKWFYSTKVILKNTFSSYFHVVKSPEGSLLSKQKDEGWGEAHQRKWKFLWFAFEFAGTSQWGPLVVWGAGTPRVLADIDDFGPLVVS